ncbi:MAG: FAD-dependent oxidoreductase [Bdellovibrionales bacterium]|nr:FAD-dependent oxidoreductase [Bdellovibrionales bacterium]
MLKFKKPKKFDYNLIVIGAGAAGLVSSYIASTLNARVALIEKNKMGGDCLNTGCVPSKALIRSAKAISQITNHKKYALKNASCEFDFAEIMERVQTIIKKIEPHDSIKRYTELGVECITGEAKITSPYVVQVGEKKYTTQAIVVATGASPLIPNIPGLESANIYTSESIWHLREQPKDMIVIGGGPIGCELAQSFQRLGTQVTLVEKMGPYLMGREDDDVAKEVTERLSNEGVKILTEHSLIEFQKKEGGNYVVLENNGKKLSLPYTACLIALGRKANVKGFGLEELGVQIRNDGTIEANEFLQTNYDNIFVCGDVTGPFQFTHTAAHQAYYASVGAVFHPLFKWLPKFVKAKFLKVDYTVIPWATYTDPEVATVGLTEKVAKAEHIQYEVTTYGIDDLDRAIADSDDNGFVKVLTQPGTDKVLGATIVHSRASDLITEFILAMRMGFGLNSILGTIHIYPTMSEANKYLAGNWKKSRKPERVLQVLRKLFAWLRGSK